MSIRLPPQPLSIALILMLAACAELPRIGAPPADAARLARLRLEEAAARGPVLVEAHGAALGQDGAARDAGLAGHLARGVEGDEVLFTTVPAEVGDPGFRVVALLDPAEGLDPGDACAGSVATATGSEASEVLLVACAGRETIASARGQTVAVSATDDRYTEMLRQTAIALFPDDYASTPRLGFAAGLETPRMPE
jgi:hypothetical protein